MKHLTKVIAIAAVAAMSVGSLSAYAAPAQNKAGQMQTKQANVRIEANAQMGALNKNVQNVPAQVNNKASFAIPQNDVGKQQENHIALKTPVKEQNETKMGVKEKAPNLEELKAELVAKLEAGEITQEEYDKAITELEAGKGKMGGMRGKGMKGEKPEKVEMTEEEKDAKVEELKADLAAKLESGEITQEEYDEAVAKINAGEYMLGGKCARGMKHHKDKPVSSDASEETEVIEEAEVTEVIERDENVLEETDVAE